MSLGITDPAEEYFKDGMWGRNSGTWKKQGLIFSYHNSYHFRDVNTSHAAGTVTVTSGTVPSGYVYIIENVNGMNFTTNHSYLSFEVYDGANSYPFYWLANPALRVCYMWNGRLVLKATERIRVIYSDTTLDDGLYTYMHGYKMKLG